MHFSANDRRTAFSMWLRTGRWPRVEAARGVEVKFNPWHDPRNGRFTFGPGGSRTQDGQARPSKSILKEDPKLSTPKTIEEADAWKTKMLAKYGRWHNISEAIKEKYRVYINGITPPKTAVNQAIEFFSGEVKWLLDSDVAILDTARALTNNPKVALKNIALGFVVTVDAIARDDTPTYVYLKRFANWLNTAPPKEIGYGYASVVGNTAMMAVGPEGTAAKLSTASRLSEAGNLASIVKNTAVRTNFEFYEVLVEKPISGRGRGAHRASANVQLYRDLQANPDLARMFDTELGTNVLEHMSSGKRLLNPLGTIWHHPEFNAHVVQLLRETEHRNPLTQPTLHPGGIGGFGAHYGN